MPLVSTCVIHGTPTSESQQDRVTGRLQHSPFLGLLLLRVFSSRSESKSFCVLSLSFFFVQAGRVVCVYSQYSCAFFCISSFCDYRWFLSGKFSYALTLALLPSAFCWLRLSSVICGFPEGEPRWSGGGGSHIPELE